jgi:hypothetical protein
MEAYIALAGAVIVYFGFTLRSIERRQSEIEYQLLALSRHLGMFAEAGSEPSENVKRLASDGSKYVEALRVYRAETNSDLKQAKRAIDPLRPRARNAKLFQ